MSVFHNNILAGASGASGAAAAGFKIDRSLRFNSGDSAYLNRTPSSAGNRKTWTWSGWVKDAHSDSDHHLWVGDKDSSESLSNTTFGRFYIESNGAIRFSGYTTAYRASSALLRDPAAWYHLVVALDTTQSTADDRIKIYVNGVQLTDFSIKNNPSQNDDLGWNTATPHTIGARSRSGTIAHYHDGYLAEIHFVDGTALAATDFGEYDDNNVWQPKEYTGSHGTNGFHLDFSDNTSTTTIAEDSSGNNNDFTANNISVTAGAGNDSMIDSPVNYTASSGNNGGNYATMNPLDNANGLTLSNGNLDAENTAASNKGSRLNFKFPSSGKWYIEATALTLGGNLCLGVSPGDQSATVTTAGTNYILINSSGSTVERYSGGSNVSYGGAFNSYSTGAILQIAYDADSQKLWFGLNNQWMDSGTTVTGNPSSGSNPTLTSMSDIFPSVSLYTSKLAINAGQRSFSYTPPTDFKSLCTQNFADPTIADGSTAMNVKTWSGDSTERAITGYNFSPDFVWIKTRSTSDEHVLSDIVRGAGKVMSSSATNKESDFADPGYWGHVKSFDSDGFTVDNGTGGYHRVNLSGRTYVGWAWDAGTSTASNTDGTMSSSVRANTSAGFSICAYTSPNSSSNQSFGHGLNAKPDFVIVKNRDSSYNWDIYHSSLGYNASLIFTGAATRSGAFSAEPTSTVVNTKHDYTHVNTDDYIAYCWTSVAGYSAFGSYTGNASSNGPFVYTGFRPKWILVKASSSVTYGNWIVHDTERSPHNESENNLYVNLNNLEDTSYKFDILSNGFKIRSTAFDGHNGDGKNYIYAAFAEHPFKTARAR